MSRSTLLALCLCLPAAGASRLLAQGAKEVIAFEEWLREFQSGTLFLRGAGGQNNQQIERMQQVFTALAATQDLTTAKRLFKAAIVTLPEADKVTLLQVEPWRAHRLARKLIAEMKADGLDEWLVAALNTPPKKDDVSPSEAALEILSLRGGDVARQAIEKARFSGETKVTAYDALGRLGTADSVPALLKACKDSEPNVRIASANSLGQILGPIYDETAEPATAGGKTSGDKTVHEQALGLRTEVLKALEQLATKDTIWQVRCAAKDTLVRLRTKEAIPVLIKGLQAESGRKDKVRRLVNGFHQALVMMTGQDLPEGRADLWEEFWTREGPSFRFARGGDKTAGKTAGDKPANKQQPTNYARYFNLEIKSDRVLFIIDFSGSMAERVRLKTRYAGGVGGGEHVKYELVKRELERAVRGLPADSTTNLIFFSTGVDIWAQNKDGRPQMMKMTDDNKASLIQYVWRTQPSGSTNLYGALQKALEIGGRGVYDKYYQTTFDTIFVLSDGAPTAGEITDTDEILRRVQEANKFKRVIINTVTFGDVNNMRFMKALAEQSGGEHLHVE